MKTVLVTGGLGFIGSNLIKILNKKKYFVINIDKVSYASNYRNISKNNFPAPAALCSAVNAADDIIGVSSGSPLPMLS